MTLTVPVPQLVTNPPAGPPELEKPVKVTLGPLRYADGSAVAAADATKVGAFIYRNLGGADELWNDASKSWGAPVADAELAARSPLPLLASTDQPGSWQGTLVAVGIKDAAGADRFKKATGGTPRYRLRAFAQATRAGATSVGLSGFSSELQFVSAADNQRFTIGFDTATAKDCNRVRFTLKNAAMVQTGFVEIRTTSGREIEIANCDGGGNVLARLLLGAAGEIRLEPAAGQAVILGGRLEAKEIRYLPHNQTVEQTL